MLLEDFFTRVGADYRPPPSTTERTVNLGVACSPEFACLPLKSTTGNFIEALEKGADTLVMVGGVGPCRFGYYAEIQKQVLSDEGHKFDFITIEPPKLGWSRFVKTLKSLAPECSYYKFYRNLKECFDKAVAVDYLERKALKVRSYEVNKGDTSGALGEAVDIIINVTRADGLSQAQRQAFDVLSGVDKDMDRQPLRIGLVGEFYMLLEPFFKFDIELWLGERGVMVERAVYLTDWIRPGDENPVSGLGEQDCARIAMPYLSQHVGGEGLATLGNTINYAQRGFDGVIHLLPFTCMPDTIAKAIMPRVTRDFDIPVLSLVIDEQTGKAGVYTRLEAFLDLVRNRSKMKKAQFSTTLEQR